MAISLLHVQFLNSYKFLGLSKQVSRFSSITLRKFSNCSDPKPVCKSVCKKDTSNSVENKVVLITGSAKGIGFAIADTLLTKGAKTVVLCDCQRKTCEEAAIKLNKIHGDGKVCFQPCDITRTTDLEKVFKCIKDRFKKLDILVNNAGVFTESNWEYSVLVNITGFVKGNFLGLKHMCCHESKGQGGVIINVAGLCGLESSYLAPIYTSSKNFQIALTKSLGTDYYFKKTGVKVMALAPSHTDTEMVKRLSEKDFPEGMGDMKKLAIEDLSKIPCQPPEECGKCVFKILEEGTNGSIWASENCNCFKLHFPEKKIIVDCSRGEAKKKSCKPIEVKECKEVNETRSVAQTECIKPNKNKDCFNTPYKKYSAKKPKSKICCPSNAAKKTMAKAKQYAQSSFCKSDYKQQLDCKSQKTPKKDSCAILKSCGQAKNEEKCSTSETTEDICKRIMSKQQISKDKKQDSCASVKKSNNKEHCTQTTEDICKEITSKAKDSKDQKTCQQQDPCKSIMSKTKDNKESKQDPCAYLKNYKDKKSSCETSKQDSCSSAKIKYDHEERLKNESCMKPQKSVKDFKEPGKLCKGAKTSKSACCLTKKANGSSKSNEDICAKLNKKLEDNKKNKV